MDSSNMAIEDMRERLLDAEAVLKLCNPSIKLSFKPIKKHTIFDKRNANVDWSESYTKLGGAATFDGVENWLKTTKQKYKVFTHTFTCSTHTCATDVFA